MIDATIFAGAIAIAMTLDRAIGQPPARLHPVVAIGRYLELAGSGLTALSPRRALVAGAAAWLAAALPLAASGWWLERAMAAWLMPAGGLIGALAGALWLGLLLWPLLAWRMLRDEVDAVERALADGLAEGRARVAMLASRDTSTLQPAEVRETAIESLAENLCDSVVAPLFWFALAGLPGAIVYRFANTADAMWGYRGRWEWAGKWAARADDLLSWLPARITALLLAPAPRSWPALARMAALTPSPNGGWPMAAMAMGLGVRLAKPGIYCLNDAARPPRAADTARAIGRATTAVRLGVAAMAMLALVARGAW